jgi:hypothetical protein
MKNIKSFNEMLKTKNVKMVEVQDWDKLVSKTYGRIYTFQQQEGCKERGTFNLTIPSEWTEDDEMHDEIPEVINGEIMGVKFEKWLERDPNAPLNPSDEELKNCNYYWGKTEKDEIDWKKDKGHINMFWERNFYPDVYTVANDLYEKGLIEAGEYAIHIDW